MYLLLSLFVALAFAKAPLFTYDDTIEGQYIVVYHPYTADELQEKHQATLGKNIFANYNISQDFMGYAAYLTKEEVEIIRDDPIVAEVHPDTHIYLFGKQQTCDTTQSNARAWGICRISHWGGINSGALNTYKYDSSTAGYGTDIYVIDTGIKLTHQEFDNRAVWGANYVDNIRDDNNGHGTHCACTAGGSTVGIARYSRLVAVRVLNGQGSGTNSGVISGVNYVATTAGSSSNNAVGSMSLGGGQNTALNNAVAACVSRGIPMAVAAGNDNSDACYYSPASTPSAITVASTSTDASNRDIRSSFSNYGSCVDVFAPGSNIYSCGITSNTAYTTMSGTSMACPHVAGLAAVVLSQRPNLSPAAVKAALIDEGNRGHITNPSTPNNVIVYSGC
jgi:subtilisin family serine protease